MLTIPVALAQPRPPLILILLGPPGGGKGTQAEKITAEFGIPSVSTGDLLRAEVKNGTALGRQVQSIMQKGDLVSDDIVNQLIAGRLSKEDARQGVILDGYPRTLSQAEFLDRLLADRKLPAPLVIDLQVPAEEIVKRLASRGRKDDEPATVRERLRVYERDTEPLIGYYRSKNLSVIDGLGTPDEVYKRVRSAITAAGSRP
jgi:adenylate kinase